MFNMFIENLIRAFYFPSACVSLTIRGSPNIGFQKACCRLQREEQDSFSSSSFGSRALEVSFSLYGI